MMDKTLSDKIKAILKGKTSSEALRPRENNLVCNLVKIPRLPATLLRLFPQLAKKFAQRKTNQVSAEWNKESKQTHAYGCHVENPLPPGADLIPARVNRWRLRDYHAVTRKIQALGEAKEPSRKHDISLLQEEVQAKQTEDVLWEEMLKAKEERQFQIGRITKYFS